MFRLANALKPSYLFAERKNSPSDNAIIGALNSLHVDTLLHCWRVESIAFRIGRTLEISESELEVLSLGAFLHDIGKKFIEPLILNKPTQLSAAEWELIRTHPLQGYHYLQPTNIEDRVKRIVLEHHRWANGQGGYPHFSESMMPDPLTQVVTVADVIDGMTSSRPYRPALPIGTCLAHLNDHVGTIFNGQIVECVTKLLDSPNANGL